MTPSDMAELGCRSEACVKGLLERDVRKDIERHTWTDLWLGDLRLPRGEISMSGRIHCGPFSCVVTLHESKKTQIAKPASLELTGFCQRGEVQQKERLHGMPAESTAESRPRHLNRQRGGYSAELENFLTSNAALMGERSNFGGLVASIERGGSGGCKGTKGVGVTRVEPFTHCGCVPPKGCGVCGMTAIHKAFERSDRCWQAWRGLTELQRNLAAARYLFSRDKIPTGMIGQLGDLAAVAYVVADSLGLSFRLVGDISKGKCRQWEDICAIALEETHRSWHEERAQADTDAAQEAES